MGRHWWNSTVAEFYFSATALCQARVEPEYAGLERSSMGPDPTPAFQGACCRNVIVACDVN